MYLTSEMELEKKGPNREKETKAERYQLPLGLADCILSSPV